MQVLLLIAELRGAPEVHTYCRCTSGGFCDEVERRWALAAELSAYKSHANLLDRLAQ